MPISRTKFAVLLLGLLLLAGAGFALLIKPSLAADPPSTAEQRDRMDKAFAELSPPASPDKFELKVPHLDPLKLSIVLTNGELNQGFLKTTFAFVIAHRGFHSAPGAGEHTPASIMAAYRAGTDGVELDTKASNNNYLVFGHDFTMGRETSNWTGQPKPEKWGPLQFYPLLDPYYAPGFNEKDNRSDPQNPQRKLLSSGAMWAADVQDNFQRIDAGSPAHKQMTLYEGLYFTAKYAPMMIWLDVKEWEDFEASATTIQQARKDLENNPEAYHVLEHIFFKATLSRLRNKAEFKDGLTGSLSDLLKTPGLHYFLVFNGGDIDTLKTLGNGDEYAGYRKFCRPELGCVGAEYESKAPNEWSTDMANLLRQKGEYMASFHNSPPYLWNWSLRDFGTTYLNETETWSEQAKAATFERWYARGDGSCCGNRYDVLKYSASLDQPEVDDLRPSRNWSEDGYQAITTDNAIEVLRDLQAKGRRNPILMKALAARNSGDYPTGGANLTDAIPADGLYRLRPYGSPSYMVVNVSPESKSPVGKLSPDSSGRIPSIHTQDALWYFEKMDAQTVRIMSTSAAFNAATYKGKYLCAFLVDSPDYPKYHVTLSDQPVNSACDTNWKLINEPDGTFYIESASTGYDLTQVDPPKGFAFSVKPPVVNAQATFYLNRVNVPFSETSKFTVGPHGYVYCGETGVDCQIPSNATMLYGTAGDFSIQTATTPCTAQKGRDVIEGASYDCFYAPATPSGPRPEFALCAEEGKLCNLHDPTSVAYGNGQGFIYKKVTSSFTCNTAAFDWDPAPGGKKNCFMVTDPKLGTGGPNQFALCANEGEMCPFKGAGAIAYGVPGSKKFLYRTFTNGMDCRSASFNVNPTAGTDNPDQRKACYYFDARLPTLDFYSQTVAEGDKITVEPGGQVWAVFGTGNSYVGRSFTYNFDCTKGSFLNDPAPLQPKRCSWAATNWPYEPTPNGDQTLLFPLCKEGATCKQFAGGISPGSIFAFASSPTSDGLADYRIINYENPGLPCDWGKTNLHFKRDPAPDVPKFCLAAKLRLPQQAPPHFTYCGQEGETCEQEGINSHIAFGAEGRFTYVWSNSKSFVCSYTAFGGRDPLPRVHKACYIYVND